ncbi:hypothetical protein D3C80_905950 [compost metagenome]
MGIKTYELSSFTPEIIWDYGHSITLLRSEKANRLNLPLENKFGLLASETDSVFAIKELKNYTLKKVSSVDLNRIPKESKKHNKRLTRNYYLVTKK